MGSILKLCADAKSIEYGREALTNNDAVDADVTVAVTFTEEFSVVPSVSLGPETGLASYVSVAATTTGFSITVSTVPVGATVYVNWVAIG